MNTSLGSLIFNEIEFNGISIFPNLKSSLNVRFAQTSTFKISFSEKLNKINHFKIKFEKKKKKYKNFSLSNH